MIDGPLTILGVDDDEVDLKTLRRYLAEIDGLDATLVECASAAEARRNLAKQPVDLIFLDFRLGADNGLELLKTIRTSGTTVPVVFLTGQGNERIAAEVARASGDDYLTKSDLSPAVLGESINRVMEAHTADQEQLGFDQMLHAMANEDHVTGLLKRHAFMDLLRQECARTERYKRPLSLLIVDLDRFAQVNETHGTEFGDRVLANMAVILRGVLRTTDHFCRYEGDRFAVALTETASELAVAASHRLREYVAKTPFSADGDREIAVTCSIGVKSVSAEDANAERALIDALAAMGQAKKAGGNQVVVAP